MPREHKIRLPFADWPAEDQRRWEAAFKMADRFDEVSCGAHLAPATRKARRESYGRFLGFISAIHPNRLTAPPEARIDRSIVAEYVSWRRRSGEVASLAADLGDLRDALKLICPNTEWSRPAGVNSPPRLAAGIAIVLPRMVVLDPNIAIGRHPTPAPSFVAKASGLRDDTIALKGYTAGSR